MRRIDLGWQARWEMLKVLLSGQARYQDVLVAMARLEKTGKPCLSRAIKEYRSPLTGEFRQVCVLVDDEWEPIPLPVPEKPENRKEIHE